MKHFSLCLEYVCTHLKKKKLMDSTEVPAWHIPGDALDCGLVFCFLDHKRAPINQFKSVPAIMKQRMLSFLAFLLWWLCFSVPGHEPRAFHVAQVLYHWAIYSQTFYFDIGPTCPDWSWTDSSWLWTWVPLPPSLPSLCITRSVSFYFIT